MTLASANGYAFILEGETEKEFYLAFLQHICHKRNVKFERIFSPETPEISYRLKYEEAVSIVKFNFVNTISQMPRADKWFTSQCVKKYGEKYQWSVFLCYDTDSYLDSISKFHEGDWKILRNSLKGTKRILDLAAAADIEDIMLQDPEGVCSYLHCAVPQQFPGRNGKAKMKNLFRIHGKAYHEGSRAKELISCLNMEKIISSGIVPLAEVEKIIFSK